VIKHKKPASKVVPPVIKEANVEEAPEHSGTFRETR
jgi:hypothetical protein